jgi:hypothetical protein
VIVDFEHEAKAVALARKLTLILLRKVPSQRALERDRNVGGLSTEHLNVFRGKLLALQLWR